jgi:hypothetical protein
MPDNREIKDGLGNLFTTRMKDISSAQSGLVQRTLLYATLYPVDYGVGGIYQHCVRPPQLGPGLTSVPIYSFLWASPTLIALIWRVRVSAFSTVNPFTAGIARFSLYSARAFTGADTGGLTVNFSGNQSKLVTAMNSSEASITYANGGALTPGTRVLDTDPLESVSVSAPVATNTPFTPTPMILLNREQGEQPLVLNSNEGFVVQATVPFGGNWQFALTTDWAEVPMY